MPHSGKMVKAALNARGMTQTELAKRIGKDQTLISRYMSGHIEVSDKAARAMAEVLEIDERSLLDQLERDRLKRKMERLSVQYKEIIGEEGETSEQALLAAGAVLVETPETTTIPLLDSVPVDKQGWSKESTERYVLPLPPDMQVNVESTFAYAVDSEKMTDDKVDAGDIIVVDTSAEVQDDDRVLVVIMGEPALKKMYRAGDTVVLQSPHEEPVILRIQEGDFRVVGRLVLCVKSFTQ